MVAGARIELATQGFSVPFVWPQISKKCPRLYHFAIVFKKSKNKKENPRKREF